MIPTVEANKFMRKDTGNTMSWISRSCNLCHPVVVALMLSTPMWYLVQNINHKPCDHL